MMGAAAIADSRRFRLAAAAALWLAAGPVAAEETRSRELGGPGGAPFEERCAPGEYLVGLKARHGHYVDAIAPICAPWQTLARSFGPVRVGTLRGGATGQFGEIRCDGVSALVSMVGEQADNRHRTVALIAPTCANALTPAQTTGKRGLDQFGTSAVDRQSRDDGLGTSAVPYYNRSSLPHCPPSALAVGIFGAYGTLVDRIGFICDTGPTPPRVVALGKRPPSPPLSPSQAQSSAAGLGGVAKAPSRAQAQVSLGTRVTPERPQPQPQAQPTGGGSCISGFVPRLARADDLVCVTPGSQARVRMENAMAAERVDPNGAWGPASCVSGFVWREAFDGDTVCVAPPIRDRVREENAIAASRTN